MDSINNLVQQVHPGGSYIRFQFATSLDGAPWYVPASNFIFEKNTTRRMPPPCRIVALIRATFNSFPRANIWVGSQWLLGALPPGLVLAQAGPGSVIPLTQCLGICAISPFP
jgi:hypothetical protein